MGSYLEKSKLAKDRNAIVGALRAGTYTCKHGSHAQTVALVSVGQVGENLGSSGDSNAALVSDF